MHKHQIHQLLQCIGRNNQLPSCNWNTQHTHISTSSTQFAKHQHSFRRWFCSPWTPQTAFHNFCTSSDDRSMCAYNKNRTIEQIKNLSNTQRLQIFTHTDTAILLAHIPHFTKTMAQCHQKSIIWASPPLTGLQLIQYFYMHTYSVHLSPSYSTLRYKRPTLTQEHLDALWPIDTTKLQREITPFC